MQIRKATINDSNAIATYLLLAMEDIVYKFLSRNNYQQALEFMLYFVRRENNQYSYQNCWIAEEEGKIIAAVDLYDGSRLWELREPVIRYVREHYNKDFNPEDETQPGEYYIDTLGVHPNMQGKGIGSGLLQFLIEEYVIRQKDILGLLVDEENLNAKKLYLRLGFKPVGRKFLAGKPMEHLQII
ncbi:MAG: GNAT family N-acetyltransferase [Paludibacter sp.]|nr:GNAT family N-acetyltransferase [Paludibacter sp.]MDD4198967.1 GNAT family N-acetyltransferase [Paludibacter sp.]